jgi:hypothetical protein
MQSVTGSAKPIQVGQQETLRLHRRVLFFWQRPELARESGQKNKTATPKAGRGFLGNAKRHWIAEGNPYPRNQSRPGYTIYLFLSSVTKTIKKSYYFTC